jgi:hypothetical protein
MTFLMSSDSLEKLLLNKKENLSEKLKIGIPN